MSVERIPKRTLLDRVKRSKVSVFKSRGRSDTVILRVLLIMVALFVCYLVIEDLGAENLAKKSWGYVESYFDKETQATEGVSTGIDDEWVSRTKAEWDKYRSYQSANPVLAALYRENVMPPQLNSLNFSVRGFSAGLLKTKTDGSTKLVCLNGVKLEKGRSECLEWGDLESLSKLLGKKSYSVRVSSRDRFTVYFIN